VKPTTAVKQIANYAAAGVPGLRANYPAVVQVNPPHLLLFWDESELTYAGPGEQYWLMTVYGQLLVGALGIPEKEVLRAEQVIGPLVDVFTPDDQGSAAYHLEDLTDDSGGGRVDFCQLRRAKASAEITVGGTQRFYGAELWFAIKLRRMAGSQ
jgi:hypothetical protein